jgi:ankyrin repeat protein
MLSIRITNTTPVAGTLISDGFRRNPVKVGAASTFLAHALSLPLLMLLAVPSGVSRNRTFSSSRSCCQAFTTTQQAVDELKQRGIEYSAKTFIQKAKDGDTDLLTLFLSAGMDPNTKGDSDRTALMEAAAQGRDKAVGLLLARGASVSLTDDEGATALHWAAKAFHSSECVEALLAHGADINTTYKGGYTPLMRAAVTGNLEVIELLLKRGADTKAVDNYGETARVLALRYHHEGAAKIIQAAGG